MSDLLFQQISTVQDNTQPNPPTVPSASVMTPLTFLTFITGSTSIATIVPVTTGMHMICFIFTTSNPGPFVVSGNIKTAVQPVQNIPVFLIYDPITALYWPGRLVSP
jgi:hypothetical protein